MGLLKSIFTSEKKKRLDEGLAKSKKSFFSKMKTAVAGKSKIDIEMMSKRLKKS